MDKKHKPTQSFAGAGAPSMRGKGKKPAVTSHKPTQTSSNLNDGNQAQM